MNANETKMETMLNPDSPIPLYHQLAQKLTGQIRAGRYQAGDLLPSENEMAATYKIGRPTVRQAMEQLVRKGMVERRRGAGTFVSQPEPEVDLFSLAGTSQAFLTKEINTSVRLLKKMKLLPSAPKTAGPFSGKPAWHFSRLVSVDQAPIVLEIFFLDPELFPGLAQHSLENRSLSELVSEKYFLRPDTGRQTFKICLIPEGHADLLALQAGSPVLEVERALNFPGTPGGIFSRLLCRTDQFVFSQTLNLGATQEIKL